MDRRSARVVLSVLACSAAFVGVWAAVAPASFYSSFPGGGRIWVAPDGPFNEHLVRDVGTLHLVLCVLSVAAAVRPEPWWVRTTGVAWLVSGVPHLLYHSAHLEVYDRLDQVLNVVALGGTVLAAAALCLPRRPDATPHVTSSARPPRAGGGRDDRGVG